MPGAEGDIRCQPEYLLPEETESIVVPTTGPCKGDRLMKLYHALTVATLMTLTPLGASLASQTAAHTKMPTKKAAASPMYECTHCNIQMTAKEAKAHGMKCSCGAKLTMVKKPAKTTMKAKRA
jgi:hypothetical protein